MTQPLRLLHIQGSFDLGGKEARMVRLMNRWGNRARHRLIVGNSSMTGALAAIDSAVDARLMDNAPDISGRPTPRRLLAIARAMRGFDLVLTYNWGAMDAVLAHRLFARWLRLPRLVHHEDGFNADEAVRLKPERNLYRRLALGSAYALVVPSCQLERIAVGPWRQPTWRVVNIPNGIDVDAYCMVPAPDAIPGHVAKPGRVVVGTLAGLRPVKNLSRLVRIIAPLRNRVTLVIVGDGPDRDAIRAEAKRLGVTALVMPGFLARPDMFLGLFDLFALTSDSEQFPIALVEAMAAGLPVLSTDVGDISEMLPHANRRFVYRADDEDGQRAGLAELVADADLRRSLGAENRARARAAFDEQAMVARYAALYDAAAGRTMLSCN